MDLVKALSEQHVKSDLPELKIGDTVRVHAKIREGNRERIQIFEGTIIAMKHAGVKLYYLRDRVGKAAKVQEKI